MEYLFYANPGVQRLTPYQPGKPIEELQRELGLSQIIKLASNENPLGPSRMAIEAMEKAAVDLVRYPDGNGFNLKQTLAQRLGVDASQITLGNGSNDILEIVPRVFADQDSEIIFSQYSFAVYGLATLAVGASAVVTPAIDYGHDLDAMGAAITSSTKVIFIANPNNPTGSWVPRQTLLQFLEQVPATVIVVLDEAYFEYVEQADYPNGIHLLDQYPNLIVTRTFSKVWGLAGLRVGYAISHPDIADLMNRVRQPFNVNLIAQQAAAAVLHDQDYLNQSVLTNRYGLRQLKQGLDGLDLTWLPSIGNFISFRIGPKSAAIYNQLLAKGIIVRPLASYEMPEFLRVSVGLESENKLFLSALTEVLAANVLTEI